MHRTVWLLALSSCVPPQQQPSYYGQQPQGQQAQGQAPSSGLSCMELFTCFQACADGECIQTCLGQADAQTQANASAMMQCGASRCENAGGDCVAQQCAAEVNACRGPEQVAYAPGQPAEPQEAPPQAEQLVYPDQPHTTANLLPWMTGQWIGTNHQFEFYGDGRVRRASGVPMYSKNTGSYACVSTINETGTVRQEGDVLIMEFPPADENHCGNKNQAAAGLTVRYRITWYKYSDLPTNLLLVDLDCDRDSMYCNNQMRRR